MKEFAFTSINLSNRASMPSARQASMLASAYALNSSRVISPRSVRKPTRMLTIASVAVSAAAIASICSYVIFSSIGVGAFDGSGTGGAVERHGSRLVRACASEVTP